LYVYVLVFSVLIWEGVLSLALILKKKDLHYYLMLRVRLKLRVAIQDFEEVHEHYFVLSNY